jgi:hypothetical protein
VENARDPKAREAFETHSGPALVSFPGPERGARNVWLVIPLSLFRVAFGLAPGFAYSAATTIT